MKRPLTSEEIKSYWDGNSDRYENSFETTTTSMFSLLIPPAKLSLATKIVEVGCGTGNGIKLLRSIIPSKVEIYASDISDSMIAKVNSKNFENVHAIQANNELLPYPDLFCDRYFANLSLQIVENAENMLKEAYRVLQPEGIAVFSVWGKQEPWNFTYLVAKACGEAGCVSTTRSNFYLNNEDDLRELIKQAGFSRVLTFFSAVPYDVTNFDESIKLSENFHTVLNAKINHFELYEEIMANIRREIEKVFESGKALTFECLVAVAFK